MSAPELLTARERELLTGIRDLLDIPYPAGSDGRAGFELALRERVFRLLGILDGLGDEVAGPETESATASIILSGIDRVAARPLGYEPEPSP